MNDSTPQDNPDNMSREEFLAAMFANMVIQQTNMAMMLLGKVPHPETGQTVRDLEAARMFIDQLEMLEVKTKGNLSKQEEGLMKQALAALHMTFVEAVDAEGTGKIAEEPSERIAAPQAAPEPVPQAKAERPATPPPTEAPPAAATDESRKKFSKKY